MHSASSILVYGRDACLAETRCWVLQGAGYRVYTTAAVADAEQVFSNQEIHLLVLCHSLSRADTQELLERAQRVRPIIARLLVTSKPYQEGPESSVAGLDGPRALIAAVRRTLNGTNSSDAHA